MSNYNIQTVEFHGQNIPTIFHNEKHYVGMKAICENIGLQWEAQYKRIKRHPVLSQGISMMDIPSKGGIQRMLCLPLEMLNGWLFGVEANRVKAEIKDTLIQYQRECFDVLFKHFHKPVEPPKLSDTLTPDQAGHIYNFIHDSSRSVPKWERPKYFSNAWGSIKHRFGVSTYKDVKARDYPTLCEFVGLTPNPELIAGELLPREETPKLQERNENHTNGLALLKFGAKVLAVQDDKLEKVAEHLKKAAIYFEEARQCRGAIYDGFHESIVRLNVTKEENQQSKEKAEEIFESWESKRFFT